MGSIPIGVATISPLGRCRRVIDFPGRDRRGGYVHDDLRLSFRADVFLRDRRRMRSHVRDLRVTERNVQSGPCVSLRRRVRLGALRAERLRDDAGALD